jgi:hypothetical protein
LSVSLTVSCDSSWPLCFGSFHFFFAATQIINITMKLSLSVCAILAASATAFTPPAMTFAVGKKKTAPAKASATKAVKAAPVKKAPIVAKKAPVVVKKAVAVVKKAPVVVKKAPVVVAKKVVAAKKVVVKKAVAAKKVVVKKAVPAFKANKSVGTVASRAIPGEQAPAILNGALIGDVGFDPCFLSTKADTIANYFNGIFDGAVQLDGLSWYREAELMHGRICMVAVLGFIVPGVSHLPGVGYDYTNPLEAWGSAPSAALLQIFAFMSALEFRRIGNIASAGSAYVVGDAQRWGQDGWNPFGLDYTKAEYAEKQLQEIKHARLAMIGFLGVVFQANASGESVADQWGAALHAPEYASKAGYFLPEGI